MENIRKFKAGQKYSNNSVCGSNCVWTFEVLRRTESSVWIQEITAQGRGEVIRRKISVFMNEETIKPFGSYSMALILGADDLVEAEVSEEDQQYLIYLREGTAMRPRQVSSKVLAAWKRVWTTKTGLSLHEFDNVFGVELLA